MTSSDYRRAAEKLRAFSDEVYPIISEMIPVGIDRLTGRVVYLLELDEYCSVYDLIFAGSGARNIIS